MSAFKAWLLSKYSYQIGGWVCWAGLAVMLSPLTKYIGPQAYEWALWGSWSALVATYGLFALQAYWESR